MIRHWEEFTGNSPYWQAVNASGTMRFQICQYSDPHYYSCATLPLARFVYVIEGGGIFRQDGEQPVTCKSNDVIYVPTNTPYTSEWVANTSFYVLDIWHSMLFQAGVELNSRICLLYEDKANTLGKSIERIEKKYAQSDPFYWLDCSSLVMKFLCDVARLKDESSLQNAGIYESVLYLRAHYDTEISTAELAEKSSFSESQFRRLFKKYMGCSPTEYRNILRIKRAEELMNICGLSATQAAEKVGFSDVNYLYRLSKKYGEKGREVPSIANQSSNETT